MSEFKLKRGYNIKLAGDVQQNNVQSLPLPEYLAIKPIDFVGLTAKLAIKIGDRVKAGSTLFTHKANDRIRVTSPAGGIVKDIVRGKRRVIESIVIQTDKRQKSQYFTIPKGAASKTKIIDVLLESGLFPCFKQRPFSKLADPDIFPRDIFISGINSAPLDAEISVIIKGEEKYFKEGLRVLSKLTSGKVHLSVLREDLSIFEGYKNVEIHSFKGLHPVGNVGVQIHHIAPIRNRKDVVWTISVQSVILIGRLFLVGKFSPDIVVKVAGSAAPEKQYYRTTLGAPVEHLIGTGLKDDETRVISGNVLTGRKVGTAGYLGFFDNLITLIPEAREPFFIGWLSPGLFKDSMSRTFLSNFLFRRRKQKIDTRFHGGLRTFVATGIYRKVFPMDIYPVQLIKSILAQDIEEMEGLGIYEIIEEDVALCEYICPSKIEFQEILRRGLDYIEQEG